LLDEHHKLNIEKDKFTEEILKIKKLKEILILEATSNKEIA